MDEKRRVNDEDVNLSDMINEYSQDNELRRKIEEMKKQKEEEKRLAQSYQASNERGSIFDSITDTGTFTQPDAAAERKMPDIRVDDDDVTKTKVHIDPKPAYDKTLVIMDNKSALDRKGSSALDDTMPLHTQETHDTALFQKQESQSYAEEEDVEEYEEEDDDDNLLARMKERKRQKEEAKQEEEEDDDDEESSAKVNKIITYVILGIVGIAIIIGAFFGVKYVLNNFLGGSDDKEKISDTNKKEETPKTNETTDPKDNDEETSKNKENIESNKAAAAQLNKQLDAYQNQLDEVNKQLEAQQKKLDEANQTLDSYASIKNEAAEIQSVYTKLTNEEITLQKQIDAEGDADKKQVLQNQMEQLKEQHATTASNYGASDLAGLKALAEQKNFDYNTKSKAAEQKKDAAQSQIDSLTTRKTELEKNIASVTTKLNKYN